MKKNTQQEIAKLFRLEEELKDKDSQVSEIVENHVLLKKSAALDSPFQ